MNIIKVKLFNLYILCGFLSIFSCNQLKEKGVEYVVYEKSNGELLNAPFVDHINWVYLETKEEALLGNDPELRVSNNEIYLIDKYSSNKFFRFDYSGKFLNTIGGVGRGPNEYVNIKDVVILDNGDIEIFSLPNVTRTLFSKEGVFKNKKEVPYLAQKMIKEENMYWIYAGYGMARNERLIKIDTLGEERGSFLPSNAKIMAMTESGSVFSRNNGRIFMHEMLNSYVYEISSSFVLPVYQFDFGSLNVPEEYFAFDDPFKAAEMLLSRPFISIEGFWENNNYVIVQGFVNDENNPRNIIGIKEKLGGQNIWHWFDCLPNGINHLFNNTCMVLTDDSILWIVIEPEKIVELSYAEKEKLFSSQIPDHVLVDDNYLLLCLHLR